MAKRMPRRQRVQPRGPDAVTAREAAPEAASTHPMLELQRTVGNQAVQRLLMRSGDDSSEERAKAYIREQIARTDRYITRAFETIEFNLFPNEQKTRLPLLHNMMTLHQATGILTREMVNTVEQAIQPVRSSYIAQQFDTIRKDVDARAEMVEALHNNPSDWYMDRMDNLTGYPGPRRWRKPAGQSVP